MMRYLIVMLVMMPLAVGTVAADHSCDTGLGDAVEEACSSHAAEEKVFNRGPRPTLCGDLSDLDQCVICPLVVWWGLDRSCDQ